MRIRIYVNHSQAQELCREPIVCIIEISTSLVLPHMSRSDSSESTLAPLNAMGLADALVGWCPFRGIANHRPGLRVSSESESPSVTSNTLSNLPQMSLGMLV